MKRIFLPIVACMALMVPCNAAAQTLLTKEQIKERKELAKQNLAGQVQSEITALIENTVSNEQLTQSEAATVTRSILASKNMIAQSIGRVVPVVEIYRVVDGNNREVMVRIAYSQEMAKAAAKAAVKKDLESRGEALHDKLDNLLGW